MTGRTPIQDRTAGGDGTAVPASRKDSYDPDRGRRVRLARRRKADSRRRQAMAAALGLNAAAVGFFGAAYAARYVPAWPLQVAALALPLMAAVAAALAVGWVLIAHRSGSRRAWAGAALHVGLTVLAAGRYGPGLVQEAWPGHGEGPPSLRVLTLNAGDDRANSVPLAADLARFEEPDLVALQEASVRVDETEAGDRIVAPQAALGFLFDGAYRSWGGGGGGRAVVLSRGVLEMEEGVDAPLDPLGMEGAGTATRFAAEWGGRPFAVYVVHFRSYRRDAQTWSHQARLLREDITARTREAEFLRAVLDAEELPFLVLGDFNATPDQWAYAHVARGHRDALTDRVGWAPTYPDDRPLVQIDAVIASDHWAFEGAQVLPSGLSDHRGVLASLRWAAPPNDRDE